MRRGRAACGLDTRLTIDGAAQQGSDLLTGASAFYAERLLERNHLT
jgi:hypothetical protein